MEDEYKTYRLVFEKILGPIVVILGVIGNLSCLLAIWHRNRHCTKPQNGMKGYMYTFLCGLALADIGYLTFNLQNLYFNFSLEIKCNHLSYMKQVLVPLCNTFKSTSDYIVICMTINRCRVMKSITDLRIQELRKEAVRENVSWNVYLQILIALLFSFVLHLPYYFYEKIDYLDCENTFDNDSISTTTVPTTTNQDLTYDQELWFIYYIINVTLVKTLPVIVIVTLNIILIKRLQVVARRRKKVKSETSINQSVRDIHENRRAWSVTNKTSIKEQKLTVLLVIIAVSYLVFTLPANVSFVYYNLNIVDIEALDAIHEPAVIITNFLESLNYAANFYIYCAVHKEIRDSFVHLCKTCLYWFTCRKINYEMNESTGPSTILSV